MPLERGEVHSYNIDRMVVEFTLLNQGKVILCAISTAAMDDLEGRRDVRPKNANIHGRSAVIRGIPAQFVIVAGQPAPFQGDRR